MKSQTLAGLLISLCAMLMVSPAAQSASNAPAAGLKPPAEALIMPLKPRAISFHGTITKVDPQARTVSLGKRTLVITTQTKIFRADKQTPATLKEAVVGGYMTGSYYKTTTGRLLANNIYLKSVGTGTAPVPSQAAQ